MNKAILIAVIGLIAVVGIAAALIMRPETKPTPTETARVILLGSGATFIYPQIDQWAKALSNQYPNIVVEYSPTGSGTGQTQFLQKVVDFAGSDPPLPRESWEKARSDPRGVIQLPVVIGSVVMIYNIPELRDVKLNLSGEVIALIYRGEIEKWSDPRIQALNPGVTLPDKPIVAVHRSDSSGTTHIFTLFLYKSAGKLWGTELVGKAIEWPVDKTGRGLGGKGNQGVADLVSRTPYSIGYVEYVYAHLLKLPMALVQNAAGLFVEATSETMKEAAKNAMNKIPNSVEDDFNEFWDSVVFAPGEKSYPITSFSFLIFYKNYPADKAEAVRKLIEFILVKGKDYLVEGYVFIPDELVKFNMKAINLITGG